MAALGDDFTSATGQFVLTTPSTTASDDDNQGIWWLVPPTPDTGLSLPTLPAGWAYEGWVVGPSGPVTTGRFTDPAAADSDLAGPTAGTDSDGPAFPGQDFITPPVDLTTEHMAVISVEPEPDNDPAPFQIKPLGGAIGTDLAPTPQSHTNIAADNNPSGTATFDP
ncbi:MAG: hypothetical protein GWN07_21225 [Actinobacteria bacterium]|nr:hypothetical protein [Actinomycetota bacterium]NIS32986.1 hypothetical protein [Actinomycetota bacterium]NIU64937.1 hypothetical protein [Actinomycetota bacterium]NIW29709.1 hypothetical protein [Actinomycetota bacterium]NIX22212.1 hypothetical protein [Actinomycetota bacterium]